MFVTSKPGRLWREITPAMKPRNILSKNSSFFQVETLNTPHTFEAVKTMVGIKYIPPKPTPPQAHRNMGKEDEPPGIIHPKTLVGSLLIRPLPCSPGLPGFRFRSASRIDAFTKGGGRGTEREPFQFVVWRHLLARLLPAQHRRCVSLFTRLPPT